jgi:cupin fold WbuC family metalloprotein
MTPTKLALENPQGDLVVLSRADLDETVAESRVSARRRIIRPYHRTNDDNLHRMFNAIQPGSYARPHRHLDPPKAEAWIVLRGKLLFVAFLEDGTIDQAIVLEAEGERFGVDLVPGRFHTIVALVPDTVIYEVKSGPYTPASDKEFAPWAPAEGAPEVDAYLADLLRVSALTPPVNPAQ